MTNLVICTPSYLPDLERCALLAEGVRRCASKDYQHVVIVPRRDFTNFDRRLRPFGTTILLEEDFVPDWLFRVPGSRRWKLSYRGWPVRGWILQQVIKIAFAGNSTADGVVFADSDTCIVRAFGSDLFARDNGRLKLRAIPGAGNTARNRPRYRVAAKLLGIPVSDYFGYHHVGNFIAWIPAHVRSMQRHIESATHQDWRKAVLHQLDFSEYILYGVYCLNVLPEAERRFIPEPGKPTIEYWAQDQLDDEHLLAFLADLPPDKVAVHIQSKTTYSWELYARTVREIWRATESPGPDVP